MPLPPDADVYEAFGLGRRVNLDLEDLSRRYYELSRKLHPDAHGGGAPEARDASVHNTAALTRAYRILRDPVARGIDWLELHGGKLGNDNKLPPELSMLVFQVQEKLDELRLASDKERHGLDADVRAELAQLQSHRDEVMKDLAANFAAWDAADHDAPALLEQLQALLARRAYLATLIRDVERALN